MENTIFSMFIYLLSFLICPCVFYNLKIDCVLIEWCPSCVTASRAFTEFMWSLNSSEMYILYIKKHPQYNVSNVMQLKVSA